MSDHLKTAPPPPQLDELLCFLVYSAGFAFNRIYRKPLQELGLTYPQYLVMVVLWENDGQSVGQICERLRLDTGTLTPLLKRLETLGMVTRKRAPEDERRVIVHLTKQGDALRARSAEVTSCVTNAVGMTAADVSALMRQLHALRDNLDGDATAAH